jgi:immune inhibitor A
VRKSIAGLLSLAVASTVGMSLTAPAAGAPATGNGPDGAAGGDTAPAVDDLPNPLEDKRRELREEALTQVINGEASPQDRGVSTVLKVGETAESATATGRQGKNKDQYVELARETTDRIFVILAEFGNERHPAYPDKDINPAIPGPATFEGPLHNAIPEPDRTVDNSTVWQPEYNRDHYQQLYFGTNSGDESLKQYYEKQSSGRYSVDGTVTDWVKVRFNEARYGRSDDPVDPGEPGDDPAVCSSNVCSNTWFLIRDAVNQWVADQQAAGRTDAEIAAELATFDVWDRYDYDGDGNFNEPDGYIDHFQIVHAGGDQADGDPSQGEDAIWSHRWYAFLPNPANPTGPPQNRLGGTQIGNLGLWVGDYTIQPENGGRSVFYHEYGHDLGLPDLYDTASGADQIGWWSIMAQSRLSAADDVGIGTRGADLGPWEKLQMGWLDYEITVAGQERTMWLGPHEYNSPKPQALVTVLPLKEVVTNLIAPFAGAHSWYSGHDNDYTATMSRQVTLPAGSATLTFQAAYDIEDCGPDPCDYAYVEVDADNDGSGWTPIPGSITKEGNGIDGTQASWVPATFDLSAYAGQTIGLRFRYATDGAVGGNNVNVPNGLFVDAIRVVAGSTVVFEDGAEAGANGWTLVGFTAVGASVTNLYDNYYISSHRSYVSYDQYLETGPYNFGFLNTRPDWVEHFSYMEGLLVWYWDTSQSDNNTSAHAGEGLIIPIDSHPRAIYRLDGLPWRCRIQMYDAPFSLTRAESFTLHVNSEPSYIRGQDAQPVFDDRRSYWDSATPTCSVQVPNAGVRIRVLEVDGTSIRIRQTSTG